MLSKASSQAAAASLPAGSATFRPSSMFALELPSWPSAALELLSSWSYGNVSYSLNSLKGGYIRDYIGATIGVIKGDTRSLDYSSC